MRAAIRRAVPEAVEIICYRVPGYKLPGKPMLYFAGFKEHFSLFAASGTFFARIQKWTPVLARIRLWLFFRLQKWKHMRAQQKAKREG